MENNNNIIINIDSTFRDKKIYKNSGKFSIYLPIKYTDIIAIRLSSIEFPNLFYTFSNIKNNLSFWISSLTISPYKLSIQEGNYNSCQIIEELNRQFEKLENLTGLKIISELNDITGQTIIKSENKFSLEFENYENGLGKYLGYENKKYENGNEYISEGIMNIIGDSYIYININDYGSLITPLGDKNILGKIILNENKTQVIFDNESNYLTKKFTFNNPETIHKLNIELLDMYGNTIDMKNLNYSFTLELFKVINYTKTNNIYYNDIKNNLDFNFRNNY